MNGRRPGNPAIHPKGAAGACRKNAALDRLSARASTSIALDISNHLSFKLQARHSGGSPPPSRRCGGSWGWTRWGCHTHRSGDRPRGRRCRAATPTPRTPRNRAASAHPGAAATGGVAAASGGPAKRRHRSDLDRSRHRHPPRRLRIQP